LEGNKKWRKHYWLTGFDFAAILSLGSPKKSGLHEIQEKIPRKPKAALPLV
jgi:hypothetical protein